MKAILVREFGGSEVLKLEEIPRPELAAGQVLVRVRATGVNPYDTYMRTGPMPSSHPSLTRRAATLPARSKPPVRASQP